MYDITFFTKERMDEFWEMVTALLKFASPSVLIYVAIVSVGILLTTVVVAFKKATRDDDNEDFDIKYYD